MGTNIDDLTKQALALPGETRAQLADILVESLEAADLGHIERLWLSEAKRRRDEVRSGISETIQGDDAMRQVRRSIRHDTPSPIERPQRKFLLGEN